MVSIVDNMISNFYVLMLVLFRITSFVFLSPVFGQKNVPGIVKIGLSFFISYIIFLTFGLKIDVTELTVIEYVLVAIKEVLIGLTIGFISSIFFSLFYITGQIIDTQIGFNMGGVIDPKMNSRISATGNLLSAYFILIFLVMDGHLILIDLLFEMYSVVPILGGQLTNMIVGTIVDGFYVAFVMGVKIALPVICIMLINEFVLGIIVKFIPQINVFVFGIPLKIFIGLLVLLSIIYPVGKVFNVIFEDIIQYTTDLIKNMV